jgi:Rad3-related DNA helicase
MDEVSAFLSSPEERIFLGYVSTAGGKTALAVATTRAWNDAGGQSVVLCPNKGLQNQYKKDAPEGTISVVTGASEFKCLSFKGDGQGTSSVSASGVSCGSSAARKSCSLRKVSLDTSGEPKSGGSGCPYRACQLAARSTARTTPLCFTPQSFIAYRDNRWLGGSLPQGDGLLVIDEAHSLPDVLADGLSLSIRLDVIDEALNLKLPVGLDTDLDVAGPSGYGGVASRDFAGGETSRVDEAGQKDPMEKDPVANSSLTLEVDVGDKAPKVRTVGAGDFEFFFSEAFFGLGGNSNHEGRPLRQIGKKQVELLTVVADGLASLASGISEMLAMGMIGELGNHFPRLAGSGMEGFEKYAEMLSSNEDKVRKIIEMASEVRWAGELVGGGFSSSDDVVPQEKWGSQVRLLVRPSVIPTSYLKKFFGGFSKIILMSGSLFKNHLERLGLVSDDMFTDDGKIIGVRRFESQSVIDPKRRMMVIDHAHGMSVNFKNIPEAFASFAKFIVLKVARKLPGEKGIIHVTSSSQAERLASYGNIMAKAYAKKTGRPVPAEFITSQKLGWAQTFKNYSERGTGRGFPTLFLVAARRYEGIDLKDSLARINIIAKTPYLNIKDSMVISLDELFKTYSVVATLTAFIQASNRAVRNKGDWALNICLDTSSSGLFQRFGQDLPEFVTEAIREEHDKSWIDMWSPPTGEEKKSFF